MTLYRYLGYDDLCISYILAWIRNKVTVIHISTATGQVSLDPKIIMNRPLGQTSGPLLSHSTIQ